MGGFKEDTNNNLNTSNSLFLPRKYGGIVWVIYLGWVPKDRSPFWESIFFTFLCRDVNFNE